MGDLPDWVQAVDNTATVVAQVTVAGFGTTTVDVSNANGVVVGAVASAANLDLNFALNWFVDFAAANPYNVQFVSAAEGPGDTAQVTFESPVYGSKLLIRNNIATSTTFTVVTSARIVTTPRCLYYNTPSRVYQYLGAWALNQLIEPFALDGQFSSWTNNGSAQISVDISTTANLFYTYVRSDSARQQRPIAVLAAGHSELVIGLPQGVGFFQVQPTAAIANGVITLIVAPAAV